MRTLTQQEAGPLTDEDLNMVSGGMQSIFMYGSTVVIVEATADYYAVHVGSPTLCQTTVGSGTLGR